MAKPRRIGRRATTPVSGVPSQASSGRSLPTAVLLQACKRVFVVGIAFAVLNATPLVLFLVIGPRIDAMPYMVQLWPMPGTAIAGTGLAASLLLAFLARRLKSDPELLLFIGSGFLVLTSFLFGLMEFWVPQFNAPNPLWIGAAILAYSSIVPSTPAATLGAGLLAATMAPLALIITRLRGFYFDATPFQYVLAFLPNYLCAGLAVVPAKIIRQLGQQVKKARELGSYRLDEMLGKGGMGEVYRASHRMLARPAAVKLIRAEVLGSHSADGARVALERFRREAQAAASLRSPHTINLYDFGIAEDGTFFLVMELLDGVDLDRLVKRFGPLEPERAVNLLVQACASLAEAHANGLIHRDIKPNNIFVCRLGLQVDFVKVLDFGLVKHDREASAESALLTAPNATAGTPGFIAPETVMGLPVDHRVDIYALGCVAYWLVTGTLVFSGPTPVAMMFQHANQPPEPPSTRTEIPLPPEFEAVILSCLAKRPEDRPASVAELATRLRAAAPVGSWTPDRAERWWAHHRPSSTGEECVGCDLTLMPAMTPDQDSEALSAAAG